MGCSVLDVGWLMLVVGTDGSAIAHELAPVVGCYKMTRGCCLLPRKAHSTPCCLLVVRCHVAKSTALVVAAAVAAAVVEACSEGAEVHSQCRHLPQPQRQPQPLLLGWVVQRWVMGRPR